MRKTTKKEQLKRKIRKQKIRNALRNKFKFWKERTGDTAQANYIAVREIADDLFVGKKELLRGSNQLIIQKGKTTTYDSSRSYDFFKPSSTKSALDFVMKNINVKNVITSTERKKQQMREKKEWAKLKKEMNV